jgi:hypothetical protein
MFPVSDATSSKMLASVSVLSSPAFLKIPVRLQGQKEKGNDRDGIRRSGVSRMREDAKRGANRRGATTRDVSRKRLKQQHRNVSAEAYRTTVNFHKPKTIRTNAVVDPEHTALTLWETECDFVPDQEVLS